MRILRDFGISHQVFQKCRIELDRRHLNANNLINRFILTNQIISDSIWKVNPGIKKPPCHEVNPYGLTKKESTLVAKKLTGQTPSFKGCLSCFQLYPFVVVKVNIFLHDLFGLLKSWCFDLTQSFFFQVPEEVLHGSIVPTIGDRFKNGK